MQHEDEVDGDQGEDAQRSAGEILAQAVWKTIELVLKVTRSNMYTSMGRVKSVGLECPMNVLGVLTPYSMNEWSTD